MRAENDLDTDRPVPPERSLPGPWTSAVGSGSTAIGGDVDRAVVVTGNYNVVYQYLDQHCPSLKDYVYNFDDERKLAQRFVGRDDIFRRLDDFTGRHCGYFRVVADAGLGKTALAAAAARRLHAPVFFANASGGRTRPDQCLNHLAVDLIARFGLAHHDHLPARPGEDSSFLGKVLAEAVGRANGPLWVVVDALDEADPPAPGRNSLLLPDRLPRGVYMLLTHRPGPVALATDAGTAQEEYPIASSDASQQADIEAYLRQEADRPEIRRALEAANPTISNGRFVAVLQSKSEGNFKYLTYVLADIAARQPGFDPLDLGSLPSGLRGYYQQFWSQMEQIKGEQGWTEWRGLYRPAIAFLAAAREAVPATWMAPMIGRPAQEIEQRALRPWRRFLSQEDRRRQDRTLPGRWRVVHQSFVDFLVDEDALELRAAHDRVASVYLSAWGGLDAGLPTLFDPSSRNDLDDYGLRHVAEHLERAGRIDDLHLLLRAERRGGGAKSEPVHAKNAWYAARERVGQTEGYLNDVARAARLVQVAAKRGVEPGRCDPTIGSGIRYALMSVSLNNLARNIPPTLIAALVARRVWLASQGLAYARVLPPKERVDALIEICSYLGHHEQESVLREALTVVGAIGDGRTSAAALSALAPRLTEPGQVDEALRVARGIGDAGARARALTVLGRAEEALEVAGAIGGDWDRAGTLAALAPRLAALGRVEEGLQMARTIDVEWARARALAALVPHLAAHGRADQALEVARGISVDWERSDALAALGRVEEALAVARAIGVEDARANALAALAPRLAESSQLDEALAVARAIGDDRARARALAALAPRLAALGRVVEGLQMARTIDVEWDRAVALAALGEVVEALAVARAIGDDRARAAALAALAPPHLC
jgi:hypothetical protein